MAQADRRNSIGIRSKAAFLRKFMEVGGDNEDYTAFARLWTPKGAQVSVGHFEEEITLSTGGVTTDTTNTIPADAIVLAVVTRTTTAITTAINFDVGTAASATLYATNAALVTKGDTGVHADHWAGASIVNSTATAVRLTTPLAAGAGAVRVACFYVELVAQTS